MSDDTLIPEEAIKARTEEWQLGAPGTGLAWYGTTLVGATGEGSLHFVSASSAQPEAVTRHKGAVLSLDVDVTTRRIFSGGDDGLVYASTPEGDCEEIYNSPGRWIEHLVISRKGQLAIGVGKKVLAWRDAVMDSYDMPSSVGGLAFDAKGTTLGAAHYGGVSLMDPWHPKREIQRLNWKGSHIAITFCPNGQFVVSAMGENALHGWRIKDKADMAMSGYPAKPRSLSWSVEEDLLASSGAGGAVVWPFSGADGPMGKSAVTLGQRDVQATCVLWHPVSFTLAIGYRDGFVQLCRADDGAMLALREADGDAIEKMSFAQNGDALGVLTERGTLGRFVLTPNS